jgi:hypothetical protein
MHHDLFFWVAIYLGVAVAVCATWMVIDPDIADHGGRLWFVSFCWPLLGLCVPLIVGNFVLGLLRPPRGGRW